MKIVTLTYLVPVDQVDQHLEDHRAWLNELFEAGVLITSGPLEPRTGGVLLLVDLSTEQVEAYLSRDPFGLAGVARYDVATFTPSRMADGVELTPAPRG